ncbi:MULTISPECIES: NADH-ubiquinone oxidoreductase-F iron-sulfur binding region domain-containing protein [unclassified Pseudomonas]|uniref:formate dehydrogenase beta subunit n=1 Tax=unclassified Pseudomonas TaxID=196821 RepID=UPI002AC8C447|nr:MULTISPECIES: NADH-ubiquinone oxidoreductase-F iron-sulfur binding region domain-containing protein [unclassified Pseudomonas]MEB0042306.1 NADH-ubiquinone oxidoreductase-F iron-sulfur binding region domain-containing protein [Pseudomonas sp. MH10]MEB0121529.1 NADH-ubiquinone oxidoreductase-F iron-sulfur binding region domain-containing protein [Pseudomonas sp. CCI1.2]WPX66106.1 NADH-ubiquinone oxidoreductase-F iron-sulfur binding region domain-containing protein [Pseudomonas sp. MH10]
MMPCFYVPGDSLACAVGADEVAVALAALALKRNLPLDLQRTSSRGLYWLEPLLEVDSPHGRIGFGPLTAADVPSLLDALQSEASDHPLALGLVEELPYLKTQQRLLFARAGITRPLSLDDYRANGGFEGLTQAIALGGEQTATAVFDSGLRGRGGAAFPAGIKWRTVRGTQSAQKYIVCNADEGDSGTFADRMLMEGDPFLLIEGMAIAGISVGANYGYIYVRSEYPQAVATLREALNIARSAGYLGADVGGSGLAFDMEVRVGAGAYICGEETALLDSLEGKRGIVRAKPPIPALKGLFGLPTLVHNVVTLASVPLILAKGAQFYRDYGMGRSLGTMPFQLAGNVRHGGLVERAFGLTLRELVEDYGGGTASGRPLKAAQVGGPLGAWVPPAQFDTPLDYEAFAAMGAMLGHGGVVVADDSLDMAHMARFAMQFCAEESCGKCTPCRIGSTRGVEVIDRLLAAPDQSGRDQQATILRDLCDTMQFGSLCALGGMTSYPVTSALKYFPADFGLQPSEADQ